MPWIATSGKEHLSFLGEMSGKKQIKGVMVLVVEGLLQECLQVLPFQKECNLRYRRELVSSIFNPTPPL